MVFAVRLNIKVWAGPLISSPPSANLNMNKASSPPSYVLSTLCRGLLTNSACQIIWNWIFTPLYYFLHFEPTPYANNTFNLIASVFLQSAWSQTAQLLLCSAFIAVFLPTNWIPDISVLASCHLDVTCSLKLNKCMMCAQLCDVTWASIKKENWSNSSNQYWLLTWWPSHNQEIFFTLITHY